MFQLADASVLAVYRVTRAFPADERYTIQAHLRRAALSVVLNIVEGSARRSTREYVNFLNIANGSAAEACYLLSLAHRLGFVRELDSAPLLEQYSEICRGLQTMIHTLEGRD